MSPQNAPEPSDSDPGIDALWNGIDELSENASVRRVFGDPIEVEGRTVIPVARIGYGFGGGFGSGPDTGEESGEGGGGGGGAGATPVGVLEVTETGTGFGKLDVSPGRTGPTGGRCSRERRRAGSPRRESRPGRRRRPAA
jgi:hypothetical protein